MMRTRNIGKTIVLASTFTLGIAAISQVAVAEEESAKRGSTAEQGSSTTSQSDRKAGKKPNASGTAQSGSSRDNAAPDEWEKAKGRGQKKGGGSTGGDTGMGSSSSQGSSTSGTSSGSGGY